MSAMQIDRLNREFGKVDHLQGNEFIDAVLSLLGLSLLCDQDQLHQVPKSGPFIILANHPYGGIDGLILLKLISAIRPEVKLMANFMLKRITQVDDFLIAVNPFEKIGSYSNMGGLRQAMDCLHKGQPLIIFPAGEVSAFRPSLQQVTDKAWHPVVGKLIARAGVPVLPVYFQGNNSVLFNLMGMIHPLLRTARLPAELFNKSGHTIRVQIGRVQQFRDIPYASSDPEKMLNYLRAYTYALATGIRKDKKRLTPAAAHRFKIKPKPIEQAVESSAMVREIGEIGDHMLFESGQYQVYAAPAQVLPTILKEIGRLRELTFRAVGEGTNRSSDLDVFDVYYLHLFIWDRTAVRIVGAYRIGKGDELFYALRKKGFYVAQLFKLDKSFHPLLQQCLELGRSWIRVEYQKRPLPLYLLWKGIMVFVRKNPRYRYLIGPVSISNSFSDFSKSLMVSFIKKYYYDAEIAKGVSPRKKFKPKFAKVDEKGLLGNEASIQFLDRLIAINEQRGVRFPVLLRHYLELNAKIVGFNVDPKFAYCLDGLMVLDLEQVPIAVLEKLSRK